jgi:hypothetical protein
MRSFRVQRVKRTAGIIGLIAALLFVTAVTTQTVNAANNATLSQTINAGTLTTDIKDASKVTVASPSFAMTTAGFSLTCQTATGTLGSNTQRIYVDNGSAADNGWTLTLAATGGATSSWSNAGATQRFDFNDPTTTGCGDGADADSVAGQMSINANAGTLTADCSTSCTTANITKGSTSAFSQGSVDSITLLNAAAASDNVGTWYLTGVSVSQTIPAAQVSESYTINLTATVTAS